ncbi:betaine/proline/choline family ABC transporter ATP-binding protein [Rhodobacteraceae bacterium XHP0102]|nr:betaine/proline/choline family ABC transporter ATP-binding protein [Rhodobacteraceae bacterium XHP0102]
MALGDVKISVQNLFKIYGPNPQAVQDQVFDGIDKTAFMQETGHVLALNNINVDMREGQITVVMGLSGSGKSTLIRHLNRLIEPTSGHVFLDGEDVLAMDEAALRDLRRRAMSMVFQKFALLPHRTVLANTILAPEARGENVKEAEEEARKWLDRVGLEGMEDSYPSQLSGGMQQRVGLARALTSNADVMLMDEAFSALDPLIRTSMQDLLLELQRDLHKTIIFITHDLDEALKLADHLVVLKDGYIVQQGDPQEILLRPAARYIEEFIQDINRARVLKVKSIMAPAKSKRGCIDVVSGHETLEAVINAHQGRVDGVFAVSDPDDPAKIIGKVKMEDIYRALVRPQMQHD